MSDLDRHVQDYLALRRGLGFKLTFHGRVLPQFVAYLDAAGASTITAALAIEWAGLPQGVLPISKAHRLGAVRGFARYLQTIEPATEVPPCGIWSSTTPRRTPYSWSDDDILALLKAAAQLEPSLRATTYETLFGLLAASGLRIGEALGLDRDHVDLTDGVITVCDGKFARSRHVPLHPSTTAALADHAARRDRLCPTPSSTTFFLTSVGTALSYNGVWRTFRALTTAIGLRTSVVQPRMHDLRHRFAVRTLIDWHRAGIGVEGRMAVLSHYLGHVNPTGTYWYLFAAPELMEIAAARLDNPGGPRR